MCVVLGFGHTVWEDRSKHPVCWLTVLSCVTHAMMCQIGILQTHLVGLDLKDFFLELHSSTWDSEGININTHSCILSARIPICPVSDHSCILSARIPICPVSDHFLPPLSEHSLPPLSEHFLSPFSKHFLPPLSEVPCLLSTPLILRQASSENTQSLTIGYQEFRWKLLQHLLCIRNTNVVEISVCVVNMRQMM